MTLPDISRSARRARRVGFSVIALIIAAACTGRSSEKDLAIQHVHGLAVDGRDLYVATHHGLYVRDGSKWSRRSDDKADHMGFSYVSRRLMFRSGHPESGGNLGVQRSTDGGRSWEPMSDVLDMAVDFHAMAATPTRRPMLLGWSQRLYRAEDDPREWEPAPGNPPGPVAAITASEDELWASTAIGLYGSSDGGDSWEEVSKRSLFAVAASSDGKLLYASDAEAPGVLRSTDGGRTWKDVGERIGTDGVIVALTASRNGRTVVAADQEAGIWISRDRGEAWSRVPPP